jgi:prepilin-type processing-associated H-X9-DG protein
MGVLAIVVLSLALILPAVARAREGAQRATCAGNLRQLGVGLSLVASEHHGLYPPMKARDCEGAPAVWGGTVDLGALCPDYIEDLDLLVCPDTPGPASALERWDNGDGVLEPCEVGAIPYVYIGWALPAMLMDADDFDAFSLNVDSFADILAADTEAVERDWSLEAPISGRDTLYRLRDGLARYQVTDICNEAAANQARKKTAIMWDAIPPRAAMPGAEGQGANVLFLDGHVEHLEWHAGSGRFPVNTAGSILTETVASE